MHGSNNSASSELVKRVEGTPFTIVESEKKWLICMGNYVAYIAPSEEDCLKAIVNKEWGLVLAATDIYQQIRKEAENEAEQKL